MRNSQVRRLLTILSVILTTNAQADFAYTIYGAGDQTCSNWLDARQARDAVMQIGMEQWIGGYLTAYEFQIKHELPRADAAAIDAWTDTYCRKNPQEKIDAAAYQMAVDLQRRSK